jgi:hypothetical protein
MLLWYLPCTAPGIAVTGVQGSARALCQQSDTVVMRLPCSVPACHMQTSAAAYSCRVRFEAKALAVKMRLLKGGPDFYDVSLTAASRELCA